MNPEDNGLERDGDRPPDPRRQSREAFPGSRGISKTPERSLPSSKTSVRPIRTGEGSPRRMRQSAGIQERIQDLETGEDHLSQLKVFFVYSKSSSLHIMSLINDMTRRDAYKYEHKEERMGKGKAVLFPQTAKKLRTVGQQIKLARLRRKMTAEDVAERAGISRSTVGQIEKGSPSVSMGMYLAVLNALALQDDILYLAKDDVLGRTYQDLDLKIPKRTRNRAF